MLCLLGCSAQSNRPESKLVGKWQEEIAWKKTKRSSFSPEYQYEFFPDGTVVMNQRMRIWTRGRFEQAGTGTYKYIDGSHLKVDLGWFWGTTVYELSWPDNDHIRLRAADSVLALERMQAK